MGDVAFGVWKNSVTSLWRHYDVIKIGVHIKKFTHSSYSLLRPRIWKLVTMGVYWPIRKISVTSLSHDSHVTKTSKSNSEKTIAVRAYCDYAYESLSLCALTELVEKFLWREYHVIVTWPKLQCPIAREPYQLAPIVTTHMEGCHYER